MNLSQTVAKATARWALINKNTGKLRRSTATRTAARNAKRPTERIFDTATGSFVR